MCFLFSRSVVFLGLPHSFSTTLPYLVFVFLLVKKSCQRYHQLARLITMALFHHQILFVLSLIKNCDSLLKKMFGCVLLKIYIVT